MGLGDPQMILHKFKQKIVGTLVHEDVEKHLLGEELDLIDNLTNPLDRHAWLGRMRLWINAKEKSLPQPPSEPAAGLSHEDGRRQKASFMTAEYAKLTKQGKKKVRDELGLVPRPPSVPGAVGQAGQAAAGALPAPASAGAPPAPAGAKSCVFSDGAKFQASRQISGDGQRRKMMLLPAGIQPGSGPCPKCRGSHPEARIS